MKNKKGSSKKKISLFKLNNKRLNKLSKQGKLKKALGKNKLVDFLTERTSGKKFDKRAVPADDEEVVAPDIPLQEADYEYYATPGRDYSFLTELSEQKKGKRKRNEAEEEENLEGEFEKRVRKGEREAEVRYLLPLKTKKGLIQRCVEIETPTEVIEEENDDDNFENGVKLDGVDDGDDNDEEEEEEDGENEMERFINEEQRKQAMKKFIKEACMQVMQDVEENISRVNHVLDHLSTKRPVFIIKYAMVSLLEVFKDIIPEYKIRTISQVEKDQRMKKETLKLLSTEESLLKNYKRYVDILTDFIKGKNLTSKNKQNPSTKLLKKKRLLRKQSIACLGDLLTTKSHFNYRTDLIAVIVNAMFHHHSKSSEVACEMVKRVFGADRQGEVTLEVVRLIGRAIKEKRFDVKPKVLDVFLSLRIKYAERGDDEGEVDVREKKKQAAMMRQKKNMMSRKEKKRQKNMKNLEKELKEVHLEDDSKYKKRFQTETISVVFLTYFRILKQEHSSRLLSSVLEGLAKFSHLINVSYFDDLFAILTKFVDSGELTARQCLHCIQTALTLLMGQGSVFNIDPHNFYVHLYKSLLSFNHCSFTDDFSSVLSCLEIMFVQRRRQVTDQRCLPYVKRMCTLATSLPPSAALPMLCLVRNILNLYPKCDMLLDTESMGSGLYEPEMQDPEHCNAHNTSLFELHLLRSSYHADLRLYSEHLLNHLPRTGRFQLPPSLAILPRAELYQDDFSHVMSCLERMKPRATEGNNNKKEIRNKINVNSKHNNGKKMIKSNKNNAISSKNCKKINKVNESRNITKNHGNNGDRKNNPNIVKEMKTKIKKNKKK